MAGDDIKKTYSYIGSVSRIMCKGHSYMIRVEMDRGRERKSFK